MPKKPLKYHSDDYESDPDIHTVTTLVSRNSAPIKTKRKEGNNKKKKEKNKKNSKVTPRNRAHSAPPTRSGRTGHDLWMTAVKHRETPALTYRHPESPRHKTTTEYWVDTLRRTGTGITTQSTGSVGTTNTFTGLKRPNETAMAYLSTSSYLRQMAGTEKSKKHGDPTAKPPTGTPAYRSQEEYYEQVLELKKQIKSLNQEISMLKAKVRRTEEDNIKKEKEIEGFLDPTKNEEMRRTIGEKRPESGAVIQSLKQKILKLENQIRDKEANYAKLHAELKTTKVEEMKVQLEMCYQEIVRLQNMKDTGMMGTSRTPTKENSAKIRALNETVLRINKQNEELQMENKALREDLNREIEGKDRKGMGDYEDMNKKQLLSVIYNLEKKIEKSKRSGDTDSLLSYDGRTDKKRRPSSAVAGKIELEGSVQDRLDQLDKRETELLEELEKYKKQVRRLKDEKTENRHKMEEYEKLIKDLQAEIDYLSDKQGKATRRREVMAGAITPRQQSPRNSRPPSGRKYSVDSTSSEGRRRRREQEEEEKLENFMKNRAAKKLQKEWKTHRKEKREQEELNELANKHREKVAARRIQREWRTHHREMEIKNQKELESKVEQMKRKHAARIIQKQWKNHRNNAEKKKEVDQDFNVKVENFRRNRAAKTIQNRWTNHKYRKHEEELDEAADLIGSALRGHSTRKSQMKRFMRDYDDYDDESEDYNDAVDLIQSSVKGHYNRKTKLKKYRDDDDSASVRNMMSSGRRSRPSSAMSSHSRTSHGSRRTSRVLERQNSRHSQRANESYDDDDDIQF
ncbi:IQ domain-containing protein E-like isoform X2 [Saccostrea echinata]|uniref:IQ domain-containing protein E-like isoform X2 n=1 Tax=Saccostrea echinata TaxID=191078 RepID=UPI002A80BD5B|nr:IQ domain-containing protein E-like isoform X2 [Saccostrea echinata]